MRASRAARGIYRTVPLPERAKTPIKDAIYRAIGPVFFRGTPAYAAWLETREGRPSRASTSGNRGYGGAIVTGSGRFHLPAADGQWEWAAYESVKARIQAVLEERVRKAHPVPRKVDDIDFRSAPNAARRIVLPEADDAPDVSIIVPAYGQLEYTVACLLAVARAGSNAVTFEVIVADDASPDGTFDVLSHVPNLRLLRQERNVGFLLNCNSAARIARGRLIVFLNNDTLVQPGWLDALARVFDEEERVGIVGPKLVYPNGYLQEAGARLRREGSVELIGLNGLPEDPRWGYRRDVDYVSGACLMIPAGLFREMGGFDERLAPAYCEDLELALRVHERGMRTVYEPAAEVIHHLSVTSGAQATDFKVRAVTRNMQTVAEQHQETLDELDDVRLVSFYLPQFHRFEQNDLWWGPGFTEWANVTQAQPNWVGQYQPRVPADLGYYDLRVPETLESQWRLAARYGIDAFCYYYYWFAGTRLLHEPLERLLDRTRPAYPFCLCWANENWTRRWDGQDNEVLMAQSHSARDDVAAIRDIARYLENPAYLRVGGRPLVLVYRVDLFPNFIRTAERWRTELRRAGLGDIELAMVESFRFAGASIDPAAYGCDAAVEFPAHHIPMTRDPTGELLNRSFAGAVADYSEAAIYKATRPHPGHRLYRGVLPGWDNTPRRQNNPFVLEDSTPGAFQAWLEAAIDETKRDLHGDNRLVFINAWNEWAEGAYIEPDRRFGHTFLEAIRNARDASRLPRPERAIPA